MRRFGLLLVGLVVISGCSKVENHNQHAGNVKATVSVHKKTTTVSVPTPSSQWSEIRDSDPMTDAVSYSLTTQDPSSHASMFIECDKDGEGVMFESPLFLRSGEVADIQTRFDSDTAETRSAFLSKTTALIRQPRNLDSYLKSNPVDGGLIPLGALSLFWELHRPHARLRVRLTSFEGDTANLDFAMAGLPNELSKLERKCRAQVHGAGATTP